MVVVGVVAVDVEDGVEAVDDGVVVVVEDGVAEDGAIRFETESLVLINPFIEFLMNSGRFWFET